MSTCGGSNQGQQSAQCNALSDGRTSEAIMVDMIRQDLGVTIDPMAWRMFTRMRFDRLSVLAHRIHDGKR